MPFCPQCGVDNPDAARFCDQCGAALIPVTAPPAASAATVVPGTMPPPAPVASGPSAGPNTCPQCGMSVIPGEAFCDNCGAPLIAQSATTAPAPAVPFTGTVPQQPTYPPPQQVQPAAPAYIPPAPAAPAYTPPAAPPTPVYTPIAPATPAVPRQPVSAPTQLIVQSSGAVITLPPQTQATVGRSDAVSGFFPDIDLTPHGALDTGVGRRHLRLFVQGGQLFAEDLDSTNGSFLNGQKLQPRQPQPLKAGDELRLGQLTLHLQG